ncbi:MAG: FAD-containing monooxygenase EthA, partial [Novosphingobium sp.]
PALPDDHTLTEWQPVDLFSSGYLQRGKHIIPKSATTTPWRLQMFHFEDKREFAEIPIDDGWLKHSRLKVHEPA